VIEEYLNSTGNTQEAHLIEREFPFSMRL
jgi:hypothetical protein